eukprot:9800457-Lingulodinium_polyedra.AAC.1
MSRPTESARLGSSTPTSPWPLPPVSGARSCHSACATGAGISTVGATGTPGRSRSVWQDRLGVAGLFC